MAGLSPEYSHCAASARTAAKTVLPVIEADLPILDLATMERTAAFLKPAVLASYLDILSGRTEALLHQLAAADARTATVGDLASAAHTLAGSAGMFGFARLDLAARRFEHAAQNDPHELPAFAGRLRAALAASLPEMSHHVPIEH